MAKTVAEVMTPNPIMVTPQTPLQDAIKLLAEKRISGLPVIDESSKLVGVISESDLMWKETGVDSPPYVMFLDSIIYLQNPARHEKEVHKALGQTVKDAMSEKPITIKPEESLKQAAHLMHEKKVRRLPVIEPESKEVIGIITQGDIIRTMAQGED
ncbi:MAG: CBS domain-containing protein [Microcystaceae cyanobacterium]